MNQGIACRERLKEGAPRAGVAPGGRQPSGGGGPRRAPTLGRGGLRGGAPTARPCSSFLTVMLASGTTRSTSSCKVRIMASVASSDAVFTTTCA